MFKKIIKRKEAGQTFVEYGVVIAVVACIAIAGFASAGNSINDKVTAMSGSTTTPEPTSGNWGVSTDGVLTLSAKGLTDDEKSRAGGTLDFTAPILFTDDNYSSTAWGPYESSIVSVNIKDHMAPSDTSYWFCGMLNLVAIDNIQNLDTSKVTDMEYLFCNCNSLTSLDVSHFDTSNVTNMDSMFCSCSSLTPLNVANFDTSNVTNMDSMFFSCSKLTSLDVSHFNTSKVTDMNCMFHDCSKLTSLDVSHFNTSNVTDMGRMFYGCDSLASLDVSHFDTSNVTDMGSMFRDCSSLTSLDVSHFDMSKAYKAYMFYNCPATHS